MIRTRRLAALAAAALVGLASTRLLAEDLDPIQLFDSAKGHCAEKRYGKCLADLQLLVGEVGRLRADVIKGVFPAAPDGWKAGDAEASVQGGLAMLGVGTQVKREYTSGDDKRATMTVTTDAGAMMQGFVMLFQNPAFLGEGKRIVTVKGRKALLEWEKGATSGTVTILLGVPGSMIQVEGSGVTDKVLQDVLAGAIDVDAVEKTLQN